jgi:diketogulonate reductase-like aldo/keto reductase
MYEYTEKVKEKKNKAVANSITQRQSCETQSFGFTDNRLGTIVQKKLQEATNTNSTFQTIQKKDNNTGLPNNLKSGIENISGYSMNDVKVHYNSGKPAQMQAHAYAQGTDIHLSSGQEKHLPHEAWHVVQQKQGRVKPTMQMNHNVNVNDDVGLEQEADIMGQKALQKKTVTNNSSKNSTPSSSEVAQLIRMDKGVTGITHLVKLVNGSLYNSDYTSNEIMEVSHGDVVEVDTDKRYRSRRGPNQETHNETDQSGDQHYLWYEVVKVNNQSVGKNVYIREDTITHLDQKAQVSAPLKSTIYGTDESNGAEMADAYNEGYRDFDCAYSYFMGKTAEAFRSFPINQGPIRIIYKFKLEEYTKASAELAQLARTPGIIIHTIMLHELPKSQLEEDINIALENLSLLGKTYHSKVGVSNVSSSGSGMPAELPQLRKSLAHLGSTLSVVENRLNPAVPDVTVRRYCSDHGIKYLAYGMNGPSGVGTCGAVPGVGAGDYKFLKDPEIPIIAKKMGITPKELRQVIYTWARNQDVSVVTRSSDQGHREQNRTDLQQLPKNTDEFLSYFAPSDSPIYVPYLRYLERSRISKEMVIALSEQIGEGWLEMYYKKVIVELGEDQLSEFFESPSEFSKLVNAPGKNKWDDVTAMRDWIALALTGTMVVPQMAGAPLQTDSATLLQFADERSITIYHATDFTVYHATETLDALSVGTQLSLPSQDVYYYEVTALGRFKKIDALNK